MSAFESMRQERARVFLASVKAQLRVAEEKQEATETELPADGLKLLVKAALEPDKRLMDLYADLGMHPMKAKQAIEALEAGGLARVHVLCRKGRGGSPRGLEVLARGVEVLGQHGIEPATKLITRGGWRHNTYGLWLRKWATREGLSCSFETKVGEKVFDVVTRSRDGELVGYEIVLSGSVAWNSSQTLRAASVAGVSPVVVVGDDMRLLQKLLAECRSEADATMKKLLFRSIGEYSPF